jgi:hypothetical protein
MGRREGDGKVQGYRETMFQIEQASTCLSSCAQSHFVLHRIVCSSRAASSWLQLPVQAAEYNGSFALSQACMQMLKDDAFSERQQRKTSSTSWKLVQRIDYDDVRCTVALQSSMIVLAKSALKSERRAPGNFRGGGRGGRVPSEYNGKADGRCAGGTRSCLGHCLGHAAGRVAHVAPRHEARQPLLNPKTRGSVPATAAAAGAPTQT